MSGYESLQLFSYHITAPPKVNAFTSRGHALMRKGLCFCLMCAGVEEILGQPVNVIYFTAQSIAEIFGHRFVRKNIASYRKKSVC